MNQIQFVGTHNSYHVGLAPGEMSVLRAQNPQGVILSITVALTQTPRRSWLAGDSPERSSLGGIARATLQLPGAMASRWAAVGSRAEAGDRLKDSLDLWQAHSLTPAVSSYRTSRLG